MIIKIGSVNWLIASAQLVIVGYSTLMRIFSLFKLWKKKIIFVRQSKTNHYLILIENRGWKREWLVYLLDKLLKVVVINDLPIV